MPSLRRSLIVYFLLLMGVALGVVGLITHQTAVNALEKRRESERARVTAECEYQQKQTVLEFDEKLVDEAERLGRDLRSKFALLNQRWEEDWRTFRLKMALLPFGDATAVGPGGLSVWATFGMIQNQPARTNVLFAGSNLGANLDNTLRRSFESDEHTGYFQLHLRGFKTIRPSHQPFELPLELDPTLTEAGEHRVSVVAADAGGPLRRAVYRTYLQPNVRFGGPRPGRGDSRPPEPRPGPPPEGLPPVFIQVAKRQAELDGRLAQLAGQRDEQLATLEAETSQERDSFRTRLATIAGLAFVGMVVGGWLVIGVGLSPLRKLSDAVSQVSERDFRLPVGKDQLTQELVPIHDRLTHSLDALRQAFEREKEAVADISHELRTPVAGLLATIDVSLRKPRTAEQYKQTLEDCRGITKQLSGLVERVMTLAYLDAGQTGVHPAPIDATDVAGECAAVIRPLAEAHGLTLTADADEPAELTTDADKLREVMLNLLHNAVEYNSPGGSVRLSVRRPSNNGAVVVEVSDTGIGMTPDVRGKIFDRFYRADPSRTATGVHAGLGLAIVKEYVDRLGGSISVESEPGQGSTFRVTLPA